MNKDKNLDEIFSNDPYGILNTKPKSSFNKSPDERLIASFKEINDFVDKYGEEPKENTSNTNEFILSARLKNLRNDLAKVELLKQYDIYNLLPDPTLNSVKEPNATYNKSKEINSIEDIFEDEAFKEIADDTAGLFDFNHTPKHFERAEADFVARRKPCKNFSEYEPLLN